MMPCFDGVYYCILRNEVVGEGIKGGRDRKSTRLNSSHSQISYAVFCLKKKSRGIDAPLTIRDLALWSVWAGPAIRCHASFSSLPRGPVSSAVPDVIGEAKG